MNQTRSCIEKEALVDYLYGESDADARRRVDAHLGSCARCADEIRSLTAVRGTIETWEPPDAAPGFRVAAEVDEPSPARIRWRPAWALAAAAVLAVAAALIVRPEIELGADGMVLRIGWRGGETEVVAEAGSSASPSDPEAAGRSAMEPPLEPTVRGTPAGLRAGGGVAGPGPAPDPEPVMGDEALLRQIRELIQADAVARQEIIEYMRQVSERR
jgi:anti-sigma factor RsiW